MPLGKGEARVMYNDLMSSFGAGSREATEAFVPGMFKDKYVGYHEMGHILAVAHGDMPPLGKMIDSSPENLDKLRRSRKASEEGREVRRCGQRLPQRHVQTPRLLVQGVVEARRVCRNRPT
jgi:hypothetical protein